MNPYKFLQSLPASPVSSPYAFWPSAGFSSSVLRNNRTWQATATYSNRITLHPCLRDLSACLPNRGRERESRWEHRQSIWWAYDEHVHVRCPLDPYQLFHQSISIQIYIKIIQNPYHLLDRSWGSWSILWISGSAIACCTFKVEKIEKILNVPNISKCTTCSKMKSDGPWKPWKPAPHQRRLTASPWSLKGPSNKSCCSCKSKKRVKIGNHEPSLTIVLKRQLNGFSAKI